MFFPASKRQIFKNFKAFIAALSLSALGALPVAAQSWPDKPAVSYTHLTLPTSDLV